MGLTLASDLSLCSGVALPQLGESDKVVFYISLLKSVRSSVHGFPLLLTLLFVEITSFVCTTSIALLSLRPSWNRLVIVANGFLNLPKLLIIKRVYHLPITWLLWFLSTWRECSQQRPICYSSSNECFGGVFSYIL